MTAEPETAVTHAPVPMLLVDLATRRILDVSNELASVVGAQRQQILGTDATEYLIGGPSPALQLLVSGEIDGYETTRRLRYPDGREPKVHVWAHAFDEARPPARAVFVIDEMDGYALPAGAATGVGSTVIGSVDSDWRIKQVSADVESVLGYTADDIKGQAFLGAVHPGDLGDLLIGLGHADSSRETVVVRLRVRGADGGWHWCRAWIARTGPTSEFTFMLRPVISADATADVGDQLRERLSRILYEVNAAAALATMSALPTSAGLQGLAELTSREWEIVTALQRGARGSDVARALNLAPSTVRNHLSSVYRKLGVNSQVELLGLLNRARPREGAEAAAGRAEPRPRK